jgi:hypothetical protein
MKRIIYSVVATFTLVCFALAQQAPDSIANDSNASSFQLRAQVGPNNTAILTWRGDPNSVGYTVQQSIGDPEHYVMVAVVGSNSVSYAATGLLGGVTYFFKVCDGLDRQFCTNEVRVRIPR